MLTPDGQIDFPALHQDFQQRLAGLGKSGPPQKDERVSIAILKGMVALGSHYLEVEPDAQEKLIVARALVMFRQLIAKDEQDAQQQAGGAK